MDDRICKDEYQSAVGNVRAEFDVICDEFRHSRISRDVFVQRVATLRKTGQRFQQEFRQAHRIMAAPTK